MSDTPVISVPAIAVPGLKIAYQMQVAEGRMIAYEAAVDSTTGKDDLNELLDRIGDAAERQKAKHDLPFHQARLAQNKEALPKLRKERAEAFALAAAEQQRRQGNRSKIVEIGPNHQQTLKQYDDRIIETEKTIRNDELRIPYLRAIIAGEELPDLFPELDRPRDEPEPMPLAAAE